MKQKFINYALLISLGASFGFAVASSGDLSNIVMSVFAFGFIGYFAALISSLDLS